MNRIPETTKDARIGFLEIDLITGAAVWSGEIDRMLGYLPGQVEPNLYDWLDAIHPGDIEQVKSLISRRHCSVPALLDIRVVAIDGAVHRVVSQWTMRLDEKGLAIAADIAVVDIGESHAADRSVAMPHAAMPLPTVLSGVLPV